MSSFAREPIQEVLHAKMNGAAEALDEAFAGMGFMLLVFNPDRGPGEGSDPRANFIANVGEEVALAALRGFLDAAERRTPGRVLVRMPEGSGPFVFPQEVLAACQRVADAARKPEHAQGATQVAAELRRLFGLPEPPPSVRTPRKQP